MSFLKKFIDSAKELKNVKCIGMCAVMLIIRVLFGMYANYTVAFFPTVKIGLDFLPIVIVAYLYGPVCAAIVSALGDFFSVLLANATLLSYSPEITACYVLEGVIFGVVLYGSAMRFRDIAIAEGAVTLLCRLPVDTLVLCRLMDLPYWETLFSRALVMIPLSLVECLIILGVSKLLFRTNTTKAQNNREM